MDPSGKFALNIAGGIGGGIAGFIGAVTSGGDLGDIAFATVAGAGLGGLNPFSGVAGLAAASGC